MEKMKEDKEKECYHLWCEYLKESKDYKRLCKWKRKGWIIDTSWIEEPQVEKIEGKLIIQPFEPYMPTKRPLPKKLKEKIDMERLKKLLSVYVDMWGDIHNDSFSFDEWYKLYKESFKESPLVQDFLPILEEKIKHSIPHAKYTAGSIEILKKDMIEVLKSDSGKLYLQIDLTSGTEKELIDKVGELIKERKGNPEIDNWEDIEDEKLKVKCLNEMRRYLEVYRDKEMGLSWEDIHSKFIEKDRDKYENKDLHTWQRDYRKAKDIIERVEMGFPLSPPLARKEQLEEP